MLSSLRQHWPEYLMEAALLGLFMVSAALFTALLEYPGSPIHRAIPDADIRRALIGLAMGLTAVGLIYSPWGQQSGAHMNPAVTLTFLRLGKVKPPDAVFYIIAQFLGGTGGVLLVKLCLGRVLSDPSVNYVATVPGSAGVVIAFLAEAAISCGLMLMVLLVTNMPRLARFTGVFAGVLVAFYITLEAPLSGMSMNPARTVASALPSGVWTAWWLYFTAPALGMLGAVEMFRLSRGLAHVGCAKLQHSLRHRCIFCGHPGEIAEVALTGPAR
ncbi:MAG: aquaporin [Verrucomicrobia bacterium]|nr:aquaporin [Verrucomicrobiota bacterium]